MAAAALLLLAAIPLFAAEKPSLVVVISVDQMRADYLDRFRPYFEKDGFNRFLERGAVYTHANHRHSYTETAPGHASIGTGLDPKDHGILSNRYFDPLRGTNPYSVTDPATKLVGAPETAPSEGSASPVRLDQAGLGDRFKERFPHARVVGVALKDRAAVFMAGRKADAAVWFDDRSARFVTSSYYPPRPSLLAFNGPRLSAFLAQPKHREWTLSGVIPPEELDRVTFDPADMARFKDSVEGMGTGFPHPLRNAKALTTSPFGDDLTLAYARFAIRDLALGRNPAGEPDLLFVGLSSTDLYGHKYGPDSKEIADGIVRLDRTLGDFLRWLDAWIGRRTDLLFLTADHGVTAIPEIARERARRAGQEPAADAFGRFNMRNPGGGRAVAEAGADRVEIERRVARDLGYTLDESRSNAEEAAIAWFEDGFVYLNRPVLVRRGIDLERAKAAVRDRLRGRAGIAAAYTNTEIGNGLPPDAPAALAVTRSFRADRAGEVYAILKTGWIWFFAADKGTTHGQPNENDTHVPLLAWGPAVARGRYDAPTSPLAIARTVAALFGFQAGEADVEPLTGFSLPGRPAAAAVRAR